MSQIIAGTYELSEKIGAGGGGIVYLGRHLRLDKAVVLKADKRTIHANPETLRREVDALKNLSHTYIPQVYDFVVDGDTVYTVMDYIEGESLDKPLKRGKRFPQAQIIEWACQLLEALCYLHSRLPHGILHSDIKPANIMLTPMGDIRLIDFNIALALGENGSVRVGYSQGYASPEHYSVDYTGAGSRTIPPAPLMSSADPYDRTETLGAAGRYDRTELLSSTETVSTGQVRRTVGSSTDSWQKKVILLDARSDIYSLGATLYHLLTGHRPAKDAEDVAPISDADISSAVAAIIEKSMRRNPEERYQSAEEMLHDFEQLHENDPRTKHHKRCITVTAAILTAIFLAGGACALAGLGMMQRVEEEARLAAENAQRQEMTARLTAEAAEETERQAKITEQKTNAALKAVRSSENAYQGGDMPSAVHFAMDALSDVTPYQSEAQKALTDALGVYDMSDGFKAYQVITLPSEPLKAVLSPEGTKLAAIYAYTLAVYDTGTGTMLAELPAEESAFANMVFLDEDRIVYAAPGAIKAFGISQKTELWSGNPATAVVCSADNCRIAAVYKDAGEAIVYDTDSGAVVQTVSFEGRRQRIPENDRFADPGDNLLALNADGSLLAVSFDDGSLDVFDLQKPDNSISLLNDSAYTHFEGGFSGHYFAFSASGKEDSVFAVIDTISIEQTGGFSSPNPFHVQADETGVYLSSENILVKLDPETGDQIERAYPGEDITSFIINDEYALTAMNNGYAFFDSAARPMGQKDGRCDFLALAKDRVLTGERNTPSLRILRMEKHPEALIFSYDPDFLHDEARISAEGNVMLFRYDSFILYGKNGNVLAEMEIPDAESVYDQQFRRAENCLEVIYRNGLIRRYSTIDGSLLSETEGEAPDGTLYEEFFTSRFRVTSPLHGTPGIFDRETGELIRELEPDAYLTYVTELEDGIVTEYVTAAGERVGFLLNEDCETLAEFPDLCDILEDGTLVFDDMRGNLRQSRVYSLQELMVLAEKN